MKLRFRCWNGETMVSPDYVDRQGVAHWHENSIPESSDNVMLWTGLLDKNSVEIYEGDIVELQPDDLECSGRAAIQWGRVNGLVLGNSTPIDCWILDEATNEDDILSGWEGVCEVIGNIYEDKEELDG